MKVGEHAEITRVFSAGDVARYRRMSQHTGGGEVLPEPMLGALFSYLLGARLPGYGTNYLKQQMYFHAPARVGEPLSARVEITRIRPDKHLVDLETRCTDARGELLASGRALVLVRDVELAQG